MGVKWTPPGRTRSTVAEMPEDATELEGPAVRVRATSGWVALLLTLSRGFAPPPRKVMLKAIRLLLT